MFPKPDLRPRAEFSSDTAGSVLSIRIRGEIDHHTATTIRRGIDALLFEKRPAKLLLDLSTVSFMDSSGLGLIMGRYALVKELGGELTVWDPSPETRAILSLAGMERLVPIAYPEGASAPRTSPVGELPPVDKRASSSRSRRRSKKPTQASGNTLGKEKKA